MTWRMIPEFVEDRIGEPVKVSPTLLLFVSLTAVRSGEGKENRDKHVNSGASHNVKINEHFFTKGPKRIERIDDGLTKGEARAFERAILNQLRGHDLWNKKDFEPFRDENDKGYTDEEVKEYFSSNNE